MEIRRDAVLAQYAAGEEVLDWLNTAFSVDARVPTDAIRLCANFTVARTKDQSTPPLESVERAWLDLRENLNRLHRERAITYGELKHGVNSAALIRDAALSAMGDGMLREALEPAIEKLKCLRKLTEACGQTFYVEILDEVLTALEGKAE